MRVRLFNHFCLHLCGRRILSISGLLLAGYLLLTLQRYLVSQVANGTVTVDQVDAHVTKIVSQPPTTTVEQLLTASEILISNSSNGTLHNITIVYRKYVYEDFIRWNRTLCSNESDLRGPHQNIIGISIYGSTSKYTDNAMFSWDQSIFPFLIPLAQEVKTLLPQWIIRLYIDFTGANESQRNFLHSFSNIDICDMHNLPLFGSSLIKYLPGKMWRFLPIFDPLVDFYLSRDLDSPMIQREAEIIDFWLQPKQKNKFFHIARDNKYHNVPILGGLWGASPGRSRRYLTYLFLPMLSPFIAAQYKGAGDQLYMSDNVWDKVKNHALIFDSYSCQTFRGRPFLSQRPIGDCFLGCIRPCCTNSTSPSQKLPPECPPACRPRKHQDWIYC